MDRHTPPGPFADTNGGCWPTLLEEQILLASFAPREEARREFELLCTSAPLINSALTTTSLLPLLYHRWHGDASSQSPRTGPENGLLERSRQVYLTTWAASKRLRPQLLQLLEAFDEADVQSVLLKGAALVAGYYHDAALRPMSDFDLLVQEADLEPAITLLQRLQWQAEGDKPVADILRQRRVGHAWQFSLTDGQSCDLHWRPVLRCHSPAVASFFWDAAETVSVYGQTARIPCATALLFHVCIHGLQWSWTGHTRWVADALTLLNSDKPVDWSGLVRVARHANMTVRLHTALAYLSTRFNAPVPPSALEELAAVKAPSWERRESIILLKECPLGFRDSLAWHVSHFHRIRPFDERWRQAQFWTGFISYLQVFLDAEDWHSFVRKSWTQLRERSAAQPS